MIIRGVGGATGGAAGGAAGARRALRAGGAAGARRALRDSRALRESGATGAGGAAGSRRAMRDSPTPLEVALRASVTGRVSFDDGARALYSTDASNYRQIPIAVVLPRSVDDVVAAMASCAAQGAPVLLRGGGTAMAGQSTNTAVIIDCSRHLDRIVWLDPGHRRARVEPGCVLDTLRDRARPHGLTFGPDPATHNHCTLGGMIGNNSCGTHSLMAGRTSDNVERLEVLTYDGLRMWVGPTSEDELAAIIAEGGRRGEIYAGMARIRDVYGDEIRRRYPDIPRRVAGYNLDELLPEKGFNVARALVGTEGTCVAVLSADLVLVPEPPERAVVLPDSLDDRLRTPMLIVLGVGRRTWSSPPESGAGSMGCFGE